MLLQLKVAGALTACFAAYWFGAHSTAVRYEKTISEQNTAMAKEKESLIQAARDQDQKWQALTNNLGRTLETQTNLAERSRQRAAETIAEYERRARNERSNDAAGCIPAEWVRIYNQSLRRCGGLPCGS